ncbi:unnamed protein product, partial [Sphacelaria rigidula]
CWCGAAGTDFDKHGTSSSCTVACSGDNSTTCGGYYAFQLYYAPLVPTSAPTPASTPAPTLYGNVGCYRDRKEDRVLTSMLTSVEMTYEVRECLRYCIESKMCDLLHSSQDGDCWCGDESTDFAVNGKSTCDIPCAGDSSDICGGYYAYTLFIVPKSVPTLAPTPAPTLYPESLGCYKDVRNSRVFT